MGDPVALAIEAVERDGFVVVSGQLDAPEIERLRAAFAATGGSDGSTEHLEITDATPQADAWQELSGHRLVASLAGGLLGTGWEVSVHGRNPRPGAGQQGLHADAPDGMPLESLFGITLIWMLDEFTVANGATRVVPGTHHRRSGPPRSLAQPSSRHPDEIVVVGQPGDVLVFSAHTWHSGRRNESDRPRRCVQMSVRSVRHRSFER